jgi:hypothetical protein
VINPTSYSVESRDYGPNDGSVDLANEKKLRLDLELVLDHDIRPVPRGIVREHARPQDLEGASVGILE